MLCIDINQIDSFLRKTIIGNCIIYGTKIYQRITIKILFRHKYLLLISDTKIRLSELKTK